MRKQHAFTLTELMMVVAIIAIIAAVSIGSYRSYVAKSKWGVVQSCITQASLNMENYRTNHGRYPIEDSWTAINGSGDCSDHYEGFITVFEEGARYVIVFCDRKKSIWNEKNDVWVMIDTSPNVVHFRNPVDEATEELPESYQAEIASECEANW